MLLVNKKLIDDNSKVGQWIKNKVLEYQDRDKPIEFESYMEKFPKRFTYTETGQPTARREETQGVWIGSQENFTIPEVGKVTINWVRDLPEIKSDGTYDVKKTLIALRTREACQKEIRRAWQSQWAMPGESVRRCS